MSEASLPVPAPTTDSSWAERYEGLRTRALENGARRCYEVEGLVLFLRQGMVSWMTEIAAGTTIPSVRPAPQQNSLPVRDDHAEITRMLASMVGSALQEAHA